MAKKIPFLHERDDFGDLLRVAADRLVIEPVLVEKDYWLMHCLWGLQQPMGKQSRLHFELKGGTSLSKGFRIIDRFSEDIDIRIEPPAELDVKTGKNQDKPAHVASRGRFYDWLAEIIRIPGIEAVQRDAEFDDAKLRSAGIRLMTTGQKAMANAPSSSNAWWHSPTTSASLSSSCTTRRTCLSQQVKHWNGAQLVDIDAMRGWAGSMTWKGIHPVVELTRKVYEKGVTLSKQAMAVVETRLARNPLLPKWDILIWPA